jgi:nucleoside-diphosphate-sugar epimerase
MLLCDRLIMTHVLVTGATGFIGYHLVKKLIDHGMAVSCLVRPKSDRSRIEPLRPRFISGDTTNIESVRHALDGVDVVYHLAGATKCLNSRRLHRVNEGGVRNVSAACAELSNPPVLIVTSSLAAAGPATDDQLRVETDPAFPVSAYGRSKRAGELAAIEYASAVPTTIVRPPIVLGEGDRDGFALFEGIAKMGVHLVPGRKDHKVSTIHVDDLAKALLLAASGGRRLSASTDDADGIYFAAAEEVLSYADLGRMIGEVLGRPRAWVIRSPMPLVWVIAATSELLSQIRRQPHILGLDKAREAAAGSWACSTATLHRDTGFVPDKPLRQRLEQIAKWYVQQGWLRESEQWTAAHRGDSKRLTT